MRYTQHMRALTAAQEDQQQAGRAAGGEGGPHNEQQQLVGEGAGQPFVRAAHRACSHRQPILAHKHNPRAERRAARARALESIYQQSFAAAEAGAYAAVGVARDAGEQASTDRGLGSINQRLRRRQRAAANNSVQQSARGARWPSVAQAIDLRAEGGQHRCCCCCCCCCVFHS